MTIKQMKRIARQVFVRRVETMDLDPLPMRYDTLPLNIAALSMDTCCYCGRDFRRFSGHAWHCKDCNKLAEQVARGAGRRAA